MDRIAQLKEFMAANPNDSFIQHALALEYIKLDDDATAQQLFEDLLLKNENYIGSYYHLGKLLERNQNTSRAIAVYEKGLRKAKEAGDQHAYNELLTAYEDLVF
jgi:tetratricopeptide (TPR) repeat protein